MSSIPWFPTQNEILDWLTDSLDCSYLDLEERKKVRTLYPNCTDESAAMHALFDEVKKNLRDEKWKRTPHFAEIVELGLLDGRDTYPSTGEEKHFVGWYRLLTEKWANFLGIRLGRFTVANEIVRVQQECQKQIEALISNRDTQTRILRFFAEIIHNDPLLLEICPPSDHITLYLRDLLSTLWVYGQSSVKSVKANYEKHLKDMEKLGWIQLPEDDSVCLEGILTMTGRLRLYEYVRITSS